MDTLKRWRRLDDPGLEVLRVNRSSQGMEVISNLTFGGEPSFSLSYEWSLDASWRTRTLTLEVIGTTKRVVSSMSPRHPGPGAYPRALASAL
jgi:hypothetical protein